ncbi:MAG: CheR family methyltransferase [bacterium]|jgi:chemotaxis protein methyltransferase CheR
MNTVAMKQDTLEAVSGLIERRLGLHFPSERHDVLARGLERGGVEMGFADPEAYAIRLLATGITPVEQDTLAQALTVGETYFFREPAALKALEEHVLPELIAVRGKSGERRIRMWSAGCCTGEEAYTLAIMLTRLIPSLSEWDITILATDINPDVLSKARAGRYREWSFRGAPAWLKTGYFNKSANDEYELAARVRQMVSFSYLNLVEDVYPSLMNNTSAMDVILCRNVMMYFAADRAKLVVGRFHRALLDGGWLVMSPSEGCPGSSALFARVSFDNTSLYQKSGAVAVPVLPPHDLSAPDRMGACVITEPPQARRDAIRAILLPTAHSESPLVPATEAYARADYEAVLKIAATLPEPAVPVLVLAARACANLGRLDEALAWCRTALERDKMHASVHHLQATVLVAKRDGPAALEALKRVLYLEPHSVLAHFTTANLMLQTGEPAKAMKYFRKTMSLLRALDDSAVVPDSDGMTAERLKVIVKHIQKSLART